MRSSTIRLMSKAFAVLTVFMVPGLLVSAVLALFSNGGFETGDFTGWTKTTFLNKGLECYPPFIHCFVSRTVGGSDQSQVLGPFPTMSQADPNTGGDLKYPRFGQYSARVNGPVTGTIANTLVQTMTIQQGDVSPLDGRIHIMFAYAPVLQDPGHNPGERPYFYVAVRNLTWWWSLNDLLYERFAFAGQPGVPWQSNGDIKYTDWQIVDIMPPYYRIHIGDVVELEVIGADCSEGTHYGYIYVDGFGSSVPGLLVVKTAPNWVYTDTDFAYTFYYQNNTGAPVNNVRVVENIPAKTPLVSADPRCASTSGVVTCTLGTLDAGITGTFQITVHVGSGMTGTIENGNYYIVGDGVPPLLGPLVSTPIYVGQADLSALKYYKIEHVTGIAFTAVARNAGPDAANGAVLSDMMPANVVNVTWTCAASGGAACTSPAGRNLYETLATFPAGGVVTYTAKGTLPDWTYFRNIVKIIPPAGADDPDPTNNAYTVARYVLFFPFGLVR